jgi:hypothetical protein
MCSMNGGQLGRICRAIDELAGCSASSDDAATGGPAPDASEGGTAQAGAACRTGAADRTGPTPHAGRDDGDIARLAAIWEMVADADPELAKRLPGYLSAAE